jgi:hypothetical protein
MEGGSNRIEKPAVANPESAPGIKLTQGLYALDVLYHDPDARTRFTTLLKTGELYAGDPFVEDALRIGLLEKGAGDTLEIRADLLRPAQEMLLSPEENQLILTLEGISLEDRERLLELLHKMLDLKEDEARPTGSSLNDLSHLEQSGLIVSIQAETGGSRVIPHVGNKYRLISESMTEVIRSAYVDKDGALRFTTDH